MLAAAATVAVVTACSSGASGGQPADGPADRGWPLVWEAWEHIDASYSGPDRLEPEGVISGALDSLLALTDSDPYPFLADVGRLRGQPPVAVPSEMVDVWRGLVLHRKQWPKVADSSRTEAVITGMVAALEARTAAYVPAQTFPDASQNLVRSVEGSYLGIGAKVFRRGDSVVLDPYKDSPADKAGIEEGDVLTAVAGRPVAGRSINEVSRLIAGPEGTKAKLRVERDGETSSLEIDVFRGNIQVPSVTHQLAPGGIGYILIERFRDNTGEQFAQSLEVLDGFDMLALILDLRSNPGGSLDTARQVGAILLPAETLFISTQAAGGDLEDLRLDKDPNRISEEDIPMVVLVNERTRGEAEVLAAALQDAGRGVIMGVPSFGIGSGYEFSELSDGSAIYLPIVRWFRPSGKALGNGGIGPDVRVELKAEDGGFSRESQFNRAYEYLDRQLPHFR